MSVALHKDSNWNVAAEGSLFSNMYKYSGRTMLVSQEERRDLFLKKQKEKRHEALDEKRNLLELFCKETVELEPMEVDPKITRNKLPFAFKLMASELFSDIPSDLTDNWLVKFCPDGVRYLVVANKAITTCYLRNGKSCMRFKSNLPGGNRENLGHRFTVLDCIYNKKVKTFFVFDVLAWNSLSLLNSEAQFRFYWLKSKFEEDPELLISTRAPNYSFVLMECLPAQLSLIQDYMFNSYTVKEELVPYEGILFYHREGHYVFGRTPLVGWLKSFMLTEVLHIDVHSMHLRNKPENYVSLEQFLSEKPKKRHRKKNIECVDMVELDAAQTDLTEEFMDN